MELMKLPSAEGRCYGTLPPPITASDYYSCAKYIMTCLKFNEVVLLLHL